ncbi:MAG: hypothetical protein KC420_00375 [Myxococcales bacterium]|nr:hypothetical protein [Myxococcales bacterium]
MVACLELYDPVDTYDFCAPECKSVVQCLRSATARGEVGSEALGSADVTVVMVPADFLMSTLENQTWCDPSLTAVPILGDYYRAEGAVAEVTALLTSVRSGFGALKALDDAVDDDARLAILDTIETEIYARDYVLPMWLVPRLRSEIAAGGWARVGLANGDLSEGGCIRELINEVRAQILGDVELADPTSVAARMEAEVSGDAAIEVFSGGYAVCQQNSDYIGALFASECSVALGGESDQCRSYRRPYCRSGECEGGVGGCDPLLCYYGDQPPSRACSQLGITEIFLGYELDGTKYVTDVGSTCDGSVVSATFSGVSVGVVTPFAVVHGRLSGPSRIPGGETLRCGSEDARREERPIATPTAGRPRASHAFNEPDAGDYCWVIHGAPTQLVAGESRLVVPSPFLEYLKEAIKPAVRFGIQEPRLPMGCGCEISESACEDHSIERCDDGIDNDFDGVADYFNPECAPFANQMPYYEMRAKVDAGGVGPCPGGMETGP